MVSSAFAEEAVMLLLIDGVQGAVASLSAISMLMSENTEE